MRLNNTLFCIPVEKILTSQEYFSILQAFALKMGWQEPATFTTLEFALADTFPCEEK